MNFITFCGFMIFVYIVRNLMLRLKTILNKYMVSCRNLSETFEDVLTIFAFF